ncbi:MAG TPA: isoleucine--tRNA ligase [Rhodospirillaceae bacterium]|jgi:isoleucyl-tRNA synthetase|nr:isoleucine--tRNA ligase [Alphaproteobacteria bacterium]MDP6781603.1 isoleucine--tRNA ligase [Alphaproteobacteria bacterium]HAQ32525.1 isoleucine--tRNA ligase [Rhodospirillaceae bacterium]
MGNDYKSTVFLPATAFPMKARLPQSEPEILDFWRRSGLAEKLRRANEGGEKFILHDGPPYANGHLHIGHALNKILKDIINRSQRMLGREVTYVPGWDCHGLPIEWKIEEKYRAKGRDKDAVPALEFRHECREFADHWITVQSEEFQRLGVDGNWTNPYTTMNFAAEAAIVCELGKFLMSGGLYRGDRPVMWSVVEKTALAEAEVEYDDHKSTQVWVRFPVVTPGKPELKDTSVVIWTTTPWTLPGNRAVAFGKDMDYVLVEVVSIEEGSLAEGGQSLIVAEALLLSVIEAAGVTKHKIVHRFKGAELAGTICRHPFHGQGYDFEVPLVEGFHVTTETGTGFVHIAPGHGSEDFEVGREAGLEVPRTVGGDGLFYDHVPLFAGMKVLEEGTAGAYFSPADKTIVAALKDSGALLATDKITHSYPHSWRSKAPLIFRTTPQWFISMETGGLREKAMAAIEDTRWVPPSGRNRIHAMVESRPDWCVSRQRAWGVPLTVFVNKENGEPLRDEKVLERIVTAVAEEGADAWFSGDPARFLGGDHDPEAYQQVTDILDVWFDSGSTHAFVLEDRDDLASPASLYLEGSDQHRGWFQSSLLESCGTRGRAPYEAVLTHGFVLDEKGHKMSKSAGNVVAPQEVIDTLGADILRLWVATSDYTVDLRIGPEILKAEVDSYRRLRNTLRYALGNLAGFDENEQVATEDMPELERWVLHRLWELDRHMRAVLDGFDFHAFFTELHTFCAVDLSAFYFDIRKDALYCDQSGAPRRRAARTVLDILLHHLTAWLAPVLCFTAEEAWCTRSQEGGASETESVHLRTYPHVPEDWRDDDLAAKWEIVRDLRRVVTGAIEIARAEKQLGSSLQAHPVVYADDAYRDSVGGLDMAEIAITSDLDFDAPDSSGSSADGLFTLEDVPGVAVRVLLAEGGKCQRCWKVLPEVPCDDEGGICSRCGDAVGNG